MHWCSGCKADKEEAEFWKNQNYCKECSRGWVKNHPEDIRRIQKEHRRTHVGARQKYQQKWYAENRALAIKLSAEWASRNREKCNGYRRKRHKRLMQTDPNYRVLHAARSRVHSALRAKKSDRTSELTGGIANMRAHIENQFKPGWDWGNHGLVWEIDHKRPLSSFDLSDPIQLRQAFHFTNTQPLSVRDNRSKGCKYPGGSSCP